MPLAWYGRFVTQHKHNSRAFNSLSRSLPSQFDGSLPSQFERLVNMRTDGFEPHSKNKNKWQATDSDQKSDVNRIQTVCRLINWHYQAQNSRKLKSKQYFVNYKFDGLWKSIENSWNIGNKRIFRWKLYLKHLLAGKSH